MDYENKKDKQSATAGNTGKITTSNTKEALSYNAQSVIGSGSFGVVYQAICVETGEAVAIKKVFQDKRYKNRELQILKELDHPNVIKIKQYFYTPGEKPDDLYLNVVMEYIQETLSKIIRNNFKSNIDMPLLLIKVYAYQMLKSINYIHAIGICHRDIKPQNILIDPQKHILKLCDFGSAKRLVKGDINVAYICSRYYRAPELIFGSTEYTINVDIWSIGCVIAELVINQPIFPGESSVDQLVEVIKVLGTPTKNQILEMNPSYKEYKFPIIKSYTWSHILKNKPYIPKEFVDLITKILTYEPNKRLRPLEAMMHPFFDELKLEKTMLCDNVHVPDSIYYFSTEEYSQDSKNIIKKLIPEWYANKQKKANK